MELTPFFFGLYKLVKYGVYPVTWLAVCSGAARGRTAGLLPGSPADPPSPKPTYSSLSGPKAIIPPLWLA
jgi:hypothetical protein